MSNWNIITINLIIWIEACFAPYIIRFLFYKIHYLGSLESSFCFCQCVENLFAYMLKLNFWRQVQCYSNDLGLTKYILLDNVWFPYRHTSHVASTRPSWTTQTVSRRVKLSHQNFKSLWQKIWGFVFQHHNSPLRWKPSATCSRTYLSILLYRAPPALSCLVLGWLLTGNRSLYWCL